MKISILNDFGEYPGLRHCSISEKSGEEFYHEILNKAFHDVYESKNTLTVDLDNTGGYASSFLDEAFGNLVYDFTLEEVIKRIEIISEQEPHWKEMIFDQSFKEWERRRTLNQNPKVTALHQPWFRLINNKLLSKVWESPVSV